MYNSSRNQLYKRQLMIGLSRAVGVRHLPQFDMMGPTGGFLPAPLNTMHIPMVTLETTPLTMYIKKTAACLVNDKELP